MASQNDVVIVGACRTPFSKFGGALRDFSTVELGALVIKEVLRRAGLSGEDVDEVYQGVVMQPEAGLNDGIIARQAVLKAGLPPETVSLTIDRACCSSLSAVQMGFRAIAGGFAKVVIACGAENMGRAPHLLPAARWGQRIGPLVGYDPIYELGYRAFNPVSVDAGEVAVEYGVTREDQDAWACRSQRRYQEALAAGKFKDELMAVEIPQKKGPPLIFDKDEFPRPDTTIEGLAKLPTVYSSPTVTAGNAPGLDTGASAILLMRRGEAERRGLQPLGTVRCVTSVASAARYIAAVPAPAIRKALATAGLTLDEVDLIEINEAFAAMPLVASKILAEGDEARLRAIREKINVNGGAVAIGHPVGASGARILMTLMYELRRRGGGKGVAAICGGLSQGDGAVIEV